MVHRERLQPTTKQDPTKCQGPDSCSPYHLDGRDPCGTNLNSRTFHPTKLSALDAGTPRSCCGRLGSLVSSRDANEPSTDSFDQYAETPVSSGNVRLHAASRDHRN